MQVRPPVFEAVVAQLSPYIGVSGLVLQLRLPETLEYSLAPDPIQHFLCKGPAVVMSGFIVQSTRLWINCYQ